MTGVQTCALPIFLSADYQYQIDDNWLVKGQVSQNKANFAATTEYDASDSVAELSAHGVFDSYSIDLGYNFRNNQLIDPFGIETANINYRSAFAQLDYQFNNQQGVILGMQLLDADNQDMLFAPRISYRYALDDYNLKVNYGRAYSAPTGIEYYFELPGLFFGDESLETTTNDMLDLQLSYNKEKLTTAFTLFYGKIKNSIYLLEITPGQALPKQFQNVDGEDHKGATFEGKYRINTSWQLEWAYTYQTSKDSLGNKAVVLSDHLVKTGIAYQNDALNIGFYNVFHSAPHNRETITNAFNETEKSYAHGTLNASYQFDTPLSFMEKLKVKLYIDNLFNSKPIFLPDPTLSNLNTLPKIAERSYYFSLEFSF